MGWVVEDHHPTETGRRAWRERGERVEFVST
jgi:hypothetical protein